MFCGPFMGHSGDPWLVAAFPFWESQASSGCDLSLVLSLGPHSELRFLIGLPVSLPQTQVPGNVTSAILGPLSSSTMYTIRVTCFYLGGGSSVLTGHVTTSESVKSRLGCSWTVSLCPI